MTVRYARPQTNRQRADYMAVALAASHFAVPEPPLFDGSREKVCNTSGNEQFWNIGGRDCAGLTFRWTPWLLSRQAV